MGNFALAFIVVFSVIACEAGAFARDDELQVVEANSPTLAKREFDFLGRAGKRADFDFMAGRAGKKRKRADFDFMAGRGGKRADFDFMAGRAGKRAAAGVKRDQFDFLSSRAGKRGGGGGSGTNSVDFLNRAGKRSSSPDSRVSAMLDEGLIEAAMIQDLIHTERVKSLLERLEAMLAQADNGREHYSKY